VPHFAILSPYRLEDKIHIFVVSYLSRLVLYEITLEAHMAISQMYLPEFDQEAANTRKTLERVPDDKWDWKPHAKSGTIGWLAGHVANLNNWATVTIQTEQLDFAPVNGPRYEPPKTRNRKELLEVFDKVTAEARTAIAGVSDADLMKPWTLLMGGQTLFTMPRAAVLRSFCFNHLVHHRGQLTMYLRTLDIPVPALYGPSADEQS
jgi:uncharacterized damage-inducible protein DinB